MDSNDDNEDEDDVISEATRDLRAHALISYVELLEKPSSATTLPDLLVKLICWVLGEYLDGDDGDSGYDVKQIVQKMVDLLYRPYQRKFENIVCRMKFGILIYSHSSLILLCKDYFRYAWNKR